MQSFPLGRYQATIISAGTFALDGGAMFGIIPKPLWEKKMPADDKNRIDMGTNCLLLRDGTRTILIDCGMGTKWPAKQAEQFKVDTTLEKSLQEAGVYVSDVTDLVLTHLHFDHAGGTTKRNAAGELELVFKNARVHIGKRNWEWAHNPNDRDRGSYRDESWLPLKDKERDRVVFVDDVNARASLLPDVDAVFCEGHTTGQMLPLVGAADQRALYAADMVPTRAHVRMAWIMGYDLRPLELLDEKRRLLSLCADDGVALVYEHDPVEPMTRIVRDGDDFAPSSSVLASAGAAHG
ncbi:MAG: MBL fold metallo-hydrolase [Deltaproteobacteria bacterium]|nr:MBL fold metallo-hydrolase [Deltaproteobacteria bacterium]